MTVGDLIDALSRFDRNLPVTIAAGPLAEYIYTNGFRVMEERIMNRRFWDDARAALVGEERWRTLVLSPNDDALESRVGPKYNDLTFKPVDSAL
jgi:hypothetical protein